jgi:hypothetical protein
MQGVRTMSVGCERETRTSECTHPFKNAGFRQTFNKRWHAVDLPVRQHPQPFGSDCAFDSNDVPIFNQQKKAVVVHDLTKLFSILENCCVTLRYFGTGNYEVRQRLWVAQIFYLFFGQFMTNEN